MHPSQSSCRGSLPSHYRHLNATSIRNTFSKADSFQLGESHWVRNRKTSKCYKKYQIVRRARTRDQPKEPLLQLGTETRKRKPVFLLPKSPQPRRWRRRQSPPRRIHGRGRKSRLSAGMEKPLSGAKRMNNKKLATRRIPGDDDWASR